MLIGQALHFGVSLFIGLACLAAGWLYLDAWSERHHGSELSKSLGFLFLTIGFLVAGAAWDDTGWIASFSNWIRLLGYLAIAAGNLMEPLQPQPNLAGDPVKASLANPAVTLTGAISSIRPAFIIGLPLSALLTTILYWRRAWPGLERHLQPLAWAFLVFTIIETLNLTALWSTSSNPLMQNIVAPLGILWFIQQLLYLLAAALLGRWVWRYLTKRPQTQIFLMTTSIVTGVTLLTTITITSLIMSNLQQTILDGLQTSAKVLQYAVSSQATASQAAAKTLSLSPAVVAATAAKDHAALSKLVTLNPLTANQYLSEVVVTGKSGDVLLRASDPERFGDIISNNTLVVRALSGATASGAIASGSSANPAVQIASVTPIVSQGTIVGTVLATVTLGNAFVDGIKNTTSLDSTIYAGNQRVATTLTGPNGLSRDLGVTENNAAINQTVLHDGSTWNGGLTISNRPYLASYQPIKDADTTVVGMLAVGQPQSVILATASRALQYTYLAAIAWLILVLVPIYFITRQISQQLR